LGTVLDNLATYVTSSTMFNYSTKRSNGQRKFTTDIKPKNHYD
jgi:hypothetical protein